MVFRCNSLIAYLSEKLGNFLHVVRLPDAFTPSAGGGLDHHRKADLCGDLHRGISVVNASLLIQIHRHVQSFPLLVIRVA